MHEPEHLSPGSDTESAAREVEYNQHLTMLERTTISVGFLLLASIWLICEMLTASHFKPYYNYLASPISDLGIPYPFDHGDTEATTFESPLAFVMNSGFIVTGWLYGLINIVLLWRTRNYQDRRILAKLVRSLRYLCSLVVIIGLTLVGLIHGGPREWQNGTQEIHNSGAFFAMLFSHINSISAGVIKGQTLPELDNHLYRYGSIVMGVSGIICEIVYTTQPRGLAGLFERLTVYLVLLWVVWNFFWIACKFKANEYRAIPDVEEESLLA